MTTETGWTQCPSAGMEYNLILTPKLNFDDAVVACQGEDAVLARISNIDAFGCVEQLLENVTIDVSVDVSFGGVNIQTRDFYIDADSNENSIERFEYVDGFENRSFFLNAEAFPWGSNQPNNPEFGGQQHCGTWAKEATVPQEERNKWLDSRCNNERSYLCHRFLPIQTNETKTEPPVGDVDDTDGYTDTTSFSTTSFLISSLILLAFIVVSALLLRREIRAKRKFHEIRLLMFPYQTTGSELSF